VPPVSETGVVIPFAPMEAYVEEADEPPVTLPVIHPADWEGQTVGPRSWVVEGLVPNHQATLLTGAGAAGKSLVSQLLCTCTGLSAPFLGVEVHSRPSLYITCEDDAEELQRRQEAICAGLGVSLESTRERLFLLSLYGQLGNELCTFDEKRTLHVSDRYREIVQTALAHHAQLLILDNTSHLFTGNENARAEVAAFVNLCNALARAIDGAVVIVGFPNKAGDSYSGSTAWENQVRSRLFMEIPKTEEGAVIDPDYRVLRNEKANYAQRGKEIGFVWKGGTFVLPKPGEVEAAIAPTLTEAQALKALREIDQRWREKKPFSAAANSPERYIGSWLQHRFKLPPRAALAQIKQWGAAGFIISEMYDAKSKKLGLRVVNWPDYRAGSDRKLPEVDQLND
jgi:RecA-family ATPase